MKRFSGKLATLKEQGRYRSLSLPNGVDLTSNDYLGLAEHPMLRDAALSFLQHDGAIGAGGSRLLRGHTDAHAELEDYAAEFFAAPSALFFATGFQANVALFQSLCSRHDTIIFDEYVHASAREAIQNSPARHIKVQHNDVTGFENALIEARASGRETIWIAVESVYSMDGDIAPLEALYDLAQRYDAMLIVDEAHGTGVMGAHGKGLAYDLYSSSLRAQRSNPRPELSDKTGDGLLRRNDSFQNLIVLHTCGKAIGVAGGLVCASEEIIDVMINAARAFIYSTAPMPLQAHLVQQSLQFIGSQEGAERRDKLKNLCTKAQQLFGCAGTHIVPIVIGDDADAVGVAAALQDKGWDIRAIRPPTVPQGTARLRLSLSANLTEEQISHFAADYKDIVQP